MLNNLDAKSAQCIKNEEKAVNVAIKVLGLVGIQPQNKSYLFFTVATLFRCLFIYLAFIYTSESEVLDEFTDGCEAFLTWIHGGTKLLTIIANRSTLNSLITDLDRFWPSEDIQGAKIVFKYGIYILITFRHIGAVAWFAYTMSPFVMQKPLLAAAIPNFPNAKYIIIFTQQVLCTIDVITILGLDILFAAFCINGIAQFRVLHHHIEQIAYKTTNELQINIKKCIEHHKFLLAYVKKLYKAYQGSMLILYGNSMLCFCLEIYSAMETESTYLLFKRITYALSLIFEVSFYCSFADKLSETALETANAMYNSEWYNFDKKTTRMVSLIIEKSQRVVTFSPYGLVNINNQALTKIFKSSLSFLTFLRQFKTEEKF